MPYLQATSLHVSPSQQDLLQHLVRRTTNPQRLVRRARIILAAGAGISNSQIAKQMQVDYETVRRWRDRWGAAESRLLQIMALACETPASSDRPVSAWTPHELADEAVKRGIVSTISARTVERFLKGERFTAPPQAVLAHSTS